MLIGFLDRENILWGTMREHEGYRQGLEFAEFLSKMNDPGQFTVVVCDAEQERYSLQEYIKKFGK